MQKRSLDWMIYLGIVFLIYVNANRASENYEAPPPPPELGPMLPGESPRDPSVLVEMDSPASGIGTAFAIDNEGTWLTARHVVDGCAVVGLNIGGRKVVRVTTEISPTTDTAVLRSEWKRRPLASDLYETRTIGEQGYFFGFPKGRPGEATGSLLGRNRLVVRGRYTSEEAILAWSELGRTRGLRGSLGGMSGGPALDKDGEVIGVVAAESPRRGRIYTVAPANLRAIIPKSTGVTGAPITTDDYGLQADRLRRDRRVAQVICIVK